MTAAPRATSPNAAFTPRLAMHGVRKRFGPTLALDEVDLIVRPGEVHAIIGENGAGKSTLMKILAGAARPDAGTMSIDGGPFAPSHPLAARQAGVAMIHQELCLAPHLSIEANITLGVEEHSLGVLRARSLRQRAREALARLDRVDIDAQARVSDLAPGARQVVEIARALVVRARIIVMDEPTSSLGLHDIERLFAVIAALKSQVDPPSVIYISHFLEEVARVADRWTVLRDGRVAATGEMRGTTTQRLVELMIGRQLQEMYPTMSPEIGATALQLRGVEGVRLPRGAELQVRSGEILGVAGLVGAGRTEMLRAAFGLDALRAGEVIVHGDATAASTARRWRQGVGMLSEDRAGEGLALNMPVAANVTFGGLSRVADLGFINPQRERAAARRHTSALDVRMRDVTQPARELSGGNQQKVALARLFYREADVLLLDEPTRGIDVASRTQIYRLIVELARTGKAIIFVSSAVNELLGVCHRVVVMHRGRIVADRPAEQWSEHAVIHAAITGRDEGMGDAHAA